MEFYFLDSRFRGNDTLQMASAQPVSPAGGEAICFIWLNSYAIFSSIRPVLLDGRRYGTTLFFRVLPTKRVRRDVGQHPDLAILGQPLELDFCHFGVPGIGAMA